MLHSDTRILTTHAGSLPRPRRLTELYAARVRGEPVDPAQLAAEGRAAVAHVVAKQIEAGIDIGNNGEQPREAFFLYVRHRMSGFGGGWSRRLFADVARYPEFGAWKAAHDALGNTISNTESVPEAVGEVRYLDRAAVEAECADFAAALASAAQGPDGRRFAEPFLTAPSPGIIATALRNRWYDTDDAYLAALGEALKVEYETIVARGFLLQIDAPDLAMERHLSFQDRPLSEFVSFVEKVVATINRALTNIPPERVRLHACWGNYEGPHDCDVAMAEVLPAIRQARVGGFVLPVANPRHAHESRCLSAFAGDPDKLVVAGVIDVLTNFVEHPEVVADRIERVAQAVGDPRRVVAGTDCGFDTSAGRGRVAEDVVWAKLASLAEGARIASRRLFGGAATKG
ncbi:MAG: cobalamin-independent methionine synthase II family protein [Rhodospirillales bacterium]|jgi:5-methyltetrahydropteroyltriglutamate--homocysteine methyltransferase|nr:cobalamin-independent methionine synthase II family protein [Rhodospirillales bacterium]